MLYAPQYALKRVLLETELLSLHTKLNSPNPHQKAEAVCIAYLLYLTIMEAWRLAKDLIIRISSLVLLQTDRQL